MPMPRRPQSPAGSRRRRGLRRPHRHPRLGGMLVVKSDAYWACAGAGQSPGTSAAGQAREQLLPIPGGEFRREISRGRTPTGVLHCHHRIVNCISSMGVTRQNIKIFTEDEIENITTNYSTPIGRGGFGEVYRGVLDGDFDLVAVKRYIRADLREEFMEEVSIHSQMCHKNVVNLIGYCIGESTLTIVTEYISNGNLDDILHNSNISIPLDIRLGIAIGCAEALGYMHSMHLLSDSLVCHGDIKPANILLDANLTAKVSDFGLSRLLLGGITQYTRNVKGSIDYMDPIYLREGCLTPKSDVYSFGAVLLELIARKRVKEGNRSLISTFTDACGKGEWSRELFDAEIASAANIKILEEIGKLATECLTLDINKRPTINDVDRRLLMLWRQRKREFLLRTQNVGTSNFMKCLGVFEMDVANSEILAKLGNVRCFTEGELNEITQNFSCLLGEGWLAEVYKGTLEDNTVVAVKKSLGVYEEHIYHFVNGVLIHAQLTHKNIIKLLGFCLEVDGPIFVYEYAAKGNLLDLLNDNKRFPLELWLKIAIRTAKALAYMHLSDSGSIRHGSVNPSNILLDDNFMPKVSGFSLSRTLTMEYDYADSVVVHRHYSDPSFVQCGLLTVKSDVYSFGIVLLELISWKVSTYHEDRGRTDLVMQYNKAYKSDKRRAAIFDKDITATQDTDLLEGIGKLATECTKPEPDLRPTMKEVAERLEALRASWNKATSGRQVLA
ncbi:hypothetical protein ACP70R_007543 [Stipagrostis hirtigluma subsp. patula]